MLTEMMIDSFHTLLEILITSAYMVNNISQSNCFHSKKKHLQILHSGHWIACHYDTKTIIKYDSHEGHNACLQNLNKEIRVFVEIISLS